MAKAAQMMDGWIYNDKARRDAALEEAGGGRQHGVAFRRFLSRIRIKLLSKSMSK